MHHNLDKGLLLVKNIVIYILIAFFHSPIRLTNTFLFTLVKQHNTPKLSYFYPPFLCTNIFKTLLSGYTGVTDKKVHTSAAVPIDPNSASDQQITFHHASFYTDGALI